MLVGHSFIVSELNRSAKWSKLCSPGLELETFALAYV